MRFSVWVPQDAAVHSTARFDSAALQGDPRLAPPLALPLASTRGCAARVALLQQLDLNV